MLYLEMLSVDPGATGDPLRIERRSLGRCDRGWHHKLGDARLDFRKRFGREGQLGASEKCRPLDLLCLGNDEIIPFMEQDEAGYSFLSETAPEEPHEFDAILELSDGDRLNILPFRMVGPDHHHRLQDSGYLS
ncbi:hypothetical protein [Phyllobacterium bourgognense]|uniref:Uncharacterized protein n=1 Tax=Phyllobacterium bourgognense TaxID=314236 RepID=A0A368YSV4_9HYPH|nr:hypothetical protein [Phyllobacterium bourgognense]RCW82346.1 hypothetical protein C7476_108160 [Phyllobacterium bourgognense]